MNIQSIFDFIESLGVIIASITATLGLYAWRKEIKWKRQNELAEEVLFNLYAARDKFGVIRNPFAHPAEGGTRPIKQNESEQETKTRNYAYTTVERFNNNREPFLNLEKLQHRYAIYFGTSNGSSILEILSIKNDIISGSYKYAQLTIECDKLINQRNNESYLQGQIDELNKKIEKNAALIWENYSEPDGISSRINKIISEQELVLNKYFR